MRDLPARYELRDRLGQGGMGEVWRVFDRERGEEVALKALGRPDDAEARFLFKQEFWAMAALRHPNLVAGFDYGETPAGVPYFTMELVPGAELAERLPRAEAEVRAMLPGLLGALAFLHARGWLHGDLKPENVRLTPDGRPKLMDLGLLTRLGKPAGAIRGTLAYLAPEAVRQGALDARADLYALGAVLMHVLTGRPPFEAPDALGLLRAHLEARPPSARERVPGLSAPMDAALRALLAKDPQDRPADAAALAALLGLEAALDEGIALRASPLVGREAVEAALQAALRGEQAGLHALEGPPGSGRTRLLDAQRAEAQLAGLPALAARGEGADAPPYEALRPWLRAVVAPPAAGTFDPEARARLLPLVARIVPEAGSAGGSGAIQPAPALEGAQERLRAHDAIAALAAAALPGPALWLLDDADRLDPASRELLAALQRVERPWRWLLAGEQPFPGATAHPLAPLTDAEVLVQAGHLLGGPVPAEAAERLPALAQGRPAAVEAALAHWIAEGALRRAQGRWEAVPAVPFTAPGDLAEALAARVAALGEAPRAIAAHAARLGAPADLAWLQAVVRDGADAPLPEAAFFAGLAALREAGALETAGDRFRFARPALAEALAAGWAPAAARAFHGRAFAALLARTAPDPAAAGLEAALALARHGLAGPTPHAGVPWAIAAARAAFAIHAVGVAEAPLRAALALDGLAPDVQAELLGLLGYVKRFAGDVDGALALYDEALVPLLRANPGPALVEHLVTRGVLLQLKGRYDDALAAHAEAINLADEAGARYQAVRARLFAGRVGVFAGQAKAARTTLAAAVKRARALEAAGGDGHDPGAVRSLLGRALSFLGYLTATAEGADAQAAAAGLAMLDEAVALNQEVGDLRETHEALNNQGNVFLALGRYPEARDVFAACLALCGRMGSPNEAVIAHLNLGAALLELGMPAEALTHARTAADAARAQGRAFPEGYALALQGAALLRTGEPALGLARVDEGLDLARAIANKYLELNVLAYRVGALLDAGRLEAAGRALADAHALAAATGNEELAPRLARAELAIAVLAGDADAPPRLAAAIAASRAADRPAQLAHLLRWQARALRDQGDARAAERAAAEALARAEALGLVRLQAELHLELAACAEALGEPARAPEALARAQALAHAAGDALGEAVAAGALGRASRDPRAARRARLALEGMLAGLDAEGQAAFRRWPERARALEAGEAEGAAGVSPGRMRHLTQLVAAIAEAEDLPAVMDQALAALIELADADRGFLVLYDGFEERERLALAAPGHEGEVADGFSANVAQQVLWTGEPLYVEDASADGALAQAASVQALALRSVLGLPLRAGGETIGVLIADSRRVTRQVGEAERELAQALAQAVALAVVHARRHGAAGARLAALEAAHALALATAGEADPQAFGQAALAAALAAAGATRGYWLAAADGPEGVAVVAARGPAGPLDPRLAPDVSQSVCRWVLAHGEPLHMVDVQAEEAFQAARSVMALGLRTVWAVPLAGPDGRVRGLLHLDSDRLAEGDAGLQALAAIGALVAAFAAR